MIVCLVNRKEKQIGENKGIRVALAHTPNLTTPRQVEGKRGFIINFQRMVERVLTSA